MKFLQSMGVDTPQEFVLLFLTLLTEGMICFSIYQGNAKINDLWENPLVSFWLGSMAGNKLLKMSNGNGNGNGHATPPAS